MPGPVRRTAVVAAAAVAMAVPDPAGRRGRDPGVSEGMTLTEEAGFMRSLGAVDAMNLDGGGSTQFASFGQVLDDPSSSPLRPVGDTAEAVPGK